MRRAALAFALLAVLAGCRASAPVAPVVPVEPASKIACAAGPLAVTVGGLEWLAYACDDGRSVGLATAPGNPAEPFFFLVRPTSEGVRVQGEGASDRAATAVAFAELMAMDAGEVAALYDRALLAGATGGR